MYKIVYTVDAVYDLKRLQKNEPKTYQKARRFISELEQHPMTGTGHPEPLKGKLSFPWTFSQTFHTLIGVFHTLSLFLFLSNTSFS